MTTVAEAAETWLAARAELKTVEKRLDGAKTVLLDYFRRTGRTHWRGRIAYHTTTYHQLDTTIARRLLGDKAAEADVERTRETLTPL